MAEDQAPFTRISVRSYPGISSVEKDSIGRQVWRGTARFIGFMGAVSQPFTQAWSMANGPGGQMGVLGSNFLRNVGTTVDIGKKVYVPRVEASPYTQAFLQSGNNIQISSEVSESLQNVLATRYDAMVSSSGDVR